MNRLTRFAANAGVQGCLCTGVVVIIVLFGIVRDFRTGDWVVTLPILVAALALMFIIRDFLVDNVESMRVVMNIAAIVGIAAAVFIPKVIGPEPLWLRAVLIGFFGAYMGCYFWMLSDKRIIVI